VKLPGQYFSLSSVGRKGAILEPGDGELSLPGIIQPVIELPAPYEAIGSAASAIPRDDTFTLNLSRQQIGVNAGGQTVGAITAGAGLWRWRGQALMQFSGTVNNASAPFLGIIDPDSNTATWAAMFLNVQPLNLLWTFDYVFNFIRPGWTIFINFPATVAGDFLNADFRMLCSRLLV
jgi:hypothetical protein